MANTWPKDRCLYPSRKQRILVHASLMLKVNDARPLTTLTARVPSIVCPYPSRMHMTLSPDCKIYKQTSSVTQPFGTDRAGFCSILLFKMYRLTYPRLVFWLAASSVLCVFRCTSRRILPRHGHDHTSTHGMSGVSESEGEDGDEC